MKIAGASHGLKIITNSVGRGLAPAANKHQITVGTGLAPVRKKFHISHIVGQPQGLSLRVVCCRIDRTGVIPLTGEMSAQADKRVPEFGRICSRRKSAKVGSDSEPSGGRLQPSRRAERDFCGKGGVA